MEKRKIGISQEMLKLIACITMLIDHLGATLLLTVQIPQLDTVYYICRMIGRLAFPLYCFLLTEGMRHTRNPIKYILRLAAGILLAELPFDLLFEGKVTLASQNVMVTLTLGAIMLWCMGKTEKKWLKVLLILPFALVADLSKCDYGSGGIAMIAVFGLFDRLWVQSVGMTLVNWQMIPTAGVTVFGIVIRIQMLAVLAMIPIAFYNGKKQTHNRAIQWGFYLFYPLHLLVLWLILMIIA